MIKVKIRLRIAKNQHIQEINDISNMYQKACELSKRFPKDYVLIEIADENSNFENWEVIAIYQNGKKL